MSEVGELGVAEAKRRFSELLDRVREGESFLVTRHGRQVAALIPPWGEPREPGRPPRRGLAEFAGILADADAAELDAMVREIYEARRHSADREAPELG